MTDELRTELDALAGVLDQQSVRLHNLQFRLTELRMMLLHGDAAFIASAAEDLAHAANIAAEGSSVRDASMSRVAGQLGLPVTAGLEQIAKQAPQPYALILEHHVAAARQQAAGLKLEGQNVHRSVNDTLDASRRLLDIDEQQEQGLLSGLV